jgi:hypothetical protein
MRRPSFLSSAECIFEGDQFDELNALSSDRLPVRDYAAVQMLRYGQNPWLRLSWWSMVRPRSARRQMTFCDWFAPSVPMLGLRNRELPFRGKSAIR